MRKVLSAVWPVARSVVFWLVFGAAYVGALAALMALVELPRELRLGLFAVAVSTVFMWILMRPSARCACASRQPGDR